MFAGHRRKSHGCLKKHAKTIRIVAQEFPGLSAVYTSLSETLFLLWEPCFDFNKSIIGLVFSPGFFQGLTHKY
jgi:hypothetical protein